MAKREVFVLENKKTAWYYTNILHWYIIGSLIT
jgi:hypothetical protein